MNKDEQIAYNYLLNQGYTEKDIDFRGNRSTDFIYSDGRKYEVKSLHPYGESLIFSKTQWDRFRESMVWIIVVKDERVIDVVPFERLSMRNLKIQIREFLGRKTINVSEETYEKLKQFKLEISARKGEHLSFSDAVDELLARYG